MAERARIEIFLEELRREAEKSLTLPNARSLMEEARLHLEDDIQARLELGATAKEAEGEAIAAFGTARAIREEADRREPRIDRSVMLTGFAVAVSYGLLGFASVETTDWMTPLSITFAAFAHIAFVVASTCARRLQFVALLSVLISTWVLGSTIEAALHVTAPYPVSGEDRRVARASAPAEAVSLRKGADDLRERVGALDRGYTEFLRTGGAMSPSRRASFTESGALRLFRRQDRVIAARTWKAAVGTGRASDLRLADGLDAEARALDQASRAPWWPQIPTEMAYVWRDEGWTALVYGAIHAVAWLLGQALRFRRRRSTSASA